MQQRLGLPIYLHEADTGQTGFLVERWPCGLVIEVGPVPQGVMQAAICRQTQLALEAGLAVLAQARRGSLGLPPQLVVHRHLGSIDVSRQPCGAPGAVLHPDLQGGDWRPIDSSTAVMLTASAQILRLADVIPAALAGLDRYWPVFINEAAYDEKGIAFSLTSRETWACAPFWGEALVALSQQLGPA
jgi:aspartoacylase